MGVFFFHLFQRHPAGESERSALSLAAQLLLFQQPLLVPGLFLHCVTVHHVVLAATPPHPSAGSPALHPLLRTVVGGRPWLAHSPHQPLNPSEHKVWTACPEPILTPFLSEDWKTRLLPSTSWNRNGIFFFVCLFNFEKSFFRIHVLACHVLHHQSRRQMPSWWFLFYFLKRQRHTTVLGLLAYLPYPNMKYSAVETYWTFAFLYAFVYMYDHILSFLYL